MADTKSRHTISSFAAPTEEDLAYFASLSFDEQRELVDAELAKGFEGEPIPLTEALKESIREQIRRAAAIDANALD